MPANDHDQDPIDCAACDTSEVDPQADCPAGPTRHELESVEWVLRQRPTGQDAAWELAHNATGSVQVADHAASAWLDEAHHDGFPVGPHGAHLRLVEDATDPRQRVYELVEDGKRDADGDGVSLTGLELLALAEEATREAQRRP